MNPLIESRLLLNRRHFFGRAGTAVGLAAFVTLLHGESAAAREIRRAGTSGLADLPHFPPRAKRVIYLFQSGAPSQMDLFDYKPRLGDLRGTELPDSIRMGQRLTGMTATQASFPIAPSRFRFARHGRYGAWVSELLPHTARVVDDLCFIKSMHTEAINHDPAITFFQTGAQLAGRPSIGAWLLERGFDFLVRVSRHSAAHPGNYSGRAFCLYSLLTASSRLRRRPATAV